MTLPQAKCHHPGEFICAHWQKDHTSWTGWLFTSFKTPLPENLIAHYHLLYTILPQLQAALGELECIAWGTQEERGPFMQPWGSPCLCWVKAFQGQPVCEGGGPTTLHHPSHVLCKEAQLTQWFPRVNSGWTMRGVGVANRTFWERVDIDNVSSWEGLLAIALQMNVSAFSNSLFSVWRIKL